MSESGAAVYSTKQVADSLGLGAAMIRKYAVALEKLTGEDIPIKRRDGRQFSLEHFQSISKAKALVDSNNGLNIETALKMSLGTAELPGAAPALVSPNRNAPELTQALSEAVARGNEPLLTELRELRQELRQSQQASLGSLTPPEKVSFSEPGAKKESLIIRFAVWLDKLVRR
jgi:hypothetical protein